jgi:hypothetical protein
MSGLDWKIAAHSRQWGAVTEAGYVCIREAKNAARIRVYQVWLQPAEGKPARIAQTFTHKECIEAAEAQWRNAAVKLGILKEPGA